MKLRLALTFLLAATIANAQVIPFGGGQGAGRSIRFIETVTDNTALTTYTFTDANMGAAATGRIIALVCSGANGNRTISSGTVGAVALSKEIEVVSATNGTTAILTAALGAGSTATIVITWSGAQARTYCAVFAMYGVASGTAITTRSDGTPAGSNLSLNTTANDVLVVGSYINTGALDVATGYTTNFNINPTAGVKFLGGSAYISTTETPRSVGISYTGSPTVTAAVAATFR